MLQHESQQRSERVVIVDDVLDSSIFRMKARSANGFASGAR